MSLPTEEAKKQLIIELVRRVWNHEDLGFADAVYPSDWNAGHGLPPGPEGVKRWHREDKATFPDVRYQIEDLIAEDDKVVVRWSASGTQEGPFGPVPPTHRTVRWAGIHVYRIEDQRIREYWVEASSMDRLVQLGVQRVPPGSVSEP